MSRGSESLVNCASCGRRVPRTKALSYSRFVTYSTDLKTADDIRVSERHKEYYCPSCGKHRHIYDKKKAQMMKKYNR